MTQTVQDRHEENVAKIARLEVEVKHVGEDVTDLRRDVKEALAEMKRESVVSLTAFRAEVKPIIDAFSTYKGIRAAALVVFVVVFAVLGAGWREIASWVLAAFKP